jgi:hypothetical protein
LDFLDSRSLNFLSLWRTVAPCGSLGHGSPGPSARDCSLESRPLAWRPGGLEEPKASCGGLWQLGAPESWAYYKRLQPGRLQPGGLEAGRLDVF